MNSFRKSPASPTSVASRHILPAEVAGWRVNPCTNLKLRCPPTRFFIGEDVARSDGGGGSLAVGITSGTANNKTLSGRIAQCV